MSDSTYRLDLASVKPLAATLKAVPLAEAPEDVFPMVMTAKQDMLERRYSQAPDTSKNPTYAQYARVVVNGQVVAEIDNHGFVTTGNAMSGMCADAIKKADAASSVSSGPGLAQARAEKIAEAMHGTIVKAPTAMSQRAFDTTPQPRTTVNDAAMRQDPEYAAIEQLQKAHAAFLAQQMEQQGSAA